MALLARLGARNGQLSLDTKHRLFEGQAQVQPEVRATADTGPGAPRRRAAEEHVEDVVDSTEACATEIEPRHALRAGMAEGVVALALRLVAQNLVRFIDLFEARFRLWVTRIAIGMKLQRQFAVRALEFLGAGTAADAEHLVVVPLDRHGGLLGL